MRCQAETWKFSEQIDERFLHDIQGKITVAGQPKREADDPIAIPQIERIKRAGVAVIDGSDQFKVAAWIDGWPGR